MAFPSRAETEALIRDRVSADPEFRARLLSDPRSAISDVIGMPVPDAVAFTVHEESLTDVHLVIPASADDELADQDLELVAGGICWTVYAGPDLCGAAKEVPL